MTLHVTAYLEVRKVTLVAPAEEGDSAACADINCCAMIWKKAHLRLRDVLVVFHCSVYELFFGFWHYYRRLVESFRREQVYRIYRCDGSGGLRLSIALDRDPGDLVSTKTVVLDIVGAESKPKAERNVLTL